MDLRESDSDGFDRYVIYVYIRFHWKILEYVWFFMKFWYSMWKPNFKLYALRYITTICMRYFVWHIRYQTRWYFFVFLNNCTYLDSSSSDVNAESSAVKIRHCKEKGIKSNQSFLGISNSLAPLLYSNSPTKWENGERVKSLWKREAIDFCGRTWLESLRTATLSSSRRIRYT